MNDTHTKCPACDAPLPGGPFEGLCPACLLDTSIALADLDQPLEALAPNEFPVHCPFPAQLGRYTVGKELGRGGASIVFRARDEALHRDVAVKILSAGPLASRDAVRRLFLEARAAAKLHHPHILPTFEVGGAESQPYLVMPLLEGGTLATRIRDGAFLHADPADIARLLRKIAFAVDHAHRHGILHRDLKPGNILFDADGEPLVADFGLVRMLDEDSSLTLSHAILGTPAYMSPEQARGDDANVTFSADIYGLGAILYELLAGHPPFIGASLAEILRKVQEEDPVAPRVLKSAIPNPQSPMPDPQPSIAGCEPELRIGDWIFRIGDLETICLKCLEKEPAERYPTAQALADDLDRFLNDEPILARPVTRLERAARWCRRKPALAGSLLLVLLLLLVLGIASPVAAYRINEARRQANERAQSANRLIKFLEAEFLSPLDPWEAREAVAPDRIDLLTAIRNAGNEIDAHFGREPELEARIRLKIGRAMERLGDAEAATPHLARALELSTTLYGSNDLRTLEVLEAEAWLNARRGELREALRMHREVLDNRERALGRLHADTLKSVHGVASALNTMGNPNEALKLLNETLASDIPLPPHDRIRLGLMAELSRSRYLLADFQGMLEVDQQIHDALRESVGPDHPDTLNQAVLVAFGLYFHGRRFAEADALALETLDRCQRALGTDHPITQSARMYAGWFASFKGLIHEGLRLKQEALSSHHDNQGPSDFQTLWMQNIVGGHYQDFLPDHGEAERFYREALAGLRKKFGTAHHETQRSLAWLAADLITQGRHTEAEGLLIELRNAVVQSQGADSRRSRRTTESLATFHGRIGKWRESAELWSELTRLEPTNLVYLAKALITSSLTDDTRRTEVLSDRLLSVAKVVPPTNSPPLVIEALLTCAPTQEFSTAHLLDLGDGQLAGSADSVRSQMLRGLIESSRGNHEAAIGALGPLSTNPAGRIAARAGFGLAAAWNALGQTREARDTFAEAEGRLLSLARSGDLGFDQEDSVQPGHLFDILLCEVSRRSAHRALTGRPTTNALDAGSLTLAREGWNGMRQELRSVNLEARGCQWSTASRSAEGLLNRDPQAWEVIETYPPSPSSPDMGSLFLTKRATLLLLSGDFDRYRSMCEQLLVTAQQGQPEFAMPALLAADLLSSETAARAIMLARSEDVDHVDGRIKPWRELRRGLAEYWAGEFDGADRFLASAKNAFHLPCKATAYAFGARASAKLGRTEEAREQLRQAQLIRASLLSDSAEDLGSGWGEFAIMEWAIHQTASALDKGGADLRAGE